jgi:hypothetical protein
LEDVEKFYYVFEPSEVFGNESDWSRNEGEEVERNSKQLASFYERVIFAFLDHFQSEAESRGTMDKPKSTKKEASFWNKLGMG